MMNGNLISMAEELESWCLIGIGRWRR
ncbi:hypothetical protein LINGRAHAP2_LOCUS24236 [Linum grandiflorum]